MKKLIPLLIIAASLNACKQGKDERGSYKNDFETMGRWKSQEVTYEAAHDGSFSTLTDPMHEFTSTFLLPYRDVKGSRSVDIITYIMSKDDGAAAKLVVSVEKGEKKYTYYAMDVTPQLTSKNAWKKVSMHVAMPADIPDDADIFIYGWDSSKKKKIFWDDFSINFK